MNLRTPLQPCPFCASPDAHLLEVDCQAWAMVCTVCGSIGPVGRDQTLASALWNNRPSQPPAA